MMRSSSILVAKYAAAAVLALCVCSEASATTLERLSLGDMTDRSMVVVRGMVTAAGAGELKNGVISTHYQLTVSEVWKGTAPAQVDIYVPGGRAQGFLQSVPGAPVLSPGVDYVVFLWIGPSGRPQIIGLSQGLFTVIAGRNGSLFLDRGAVAEMMVDSKTGIPVTPQTVHIQAAELKKFVQGRVATIQKAAGGK